MTSADDRREQAELAAYRMFAVATRDAKAAYDADMARIRNATGRDWFRAREQARANFYRDTVEARRLFDRSVEDIMATGDFSDATNAAWNALPAGKVPA